MIPFTPAHTRPWIGQQAPAGAPAPIVSAPAPSGYTGVPGVIETLAVLAISGAAAWTGVRAGMKEHGTRQVVSYIGGIGAAALGLLYLGEKSGISAKVGLPGVRIS